MSPTILRPEKAPPHFLWAGFATDRVLAVCLSTLFVFADIAHAQITKENQLKAAFVYNFTKFIEWPATRFADETSPIVIGVLGRNPFGGELEKIVEGRTVAGRAILVKLIHTADEAPAVHLLFVPAGEESRLPAAAWPDVAVATVGESEAFVALGGMITFIQEGDQLRFEIEIGTAERCGLKISSQLQKLAKAVRRRP
jgi:hypothetical protein